VVSQKRGSRWISGQFRCIGATCREVVRRAHRPCIKISRLREQIKRDISEDRGRLHTTKKPMLPKCDMTRDEEMFSDVIITTITFMFNTITKKTTKMRTGF
jgi:hypothetical protein